MADGTSLDPNATSPDRIRRNWAKLIKLGPLATVPMAAPISVTGSPGTLTLALLTAGGLFVSGGSLSIKLNTNPGLQLASGGLSIKLDTTPGLQLGSGGLSSKVDAAGAITVGASGLAAATDGVTVEISSNQIRIKNGAITGAKFGWATAKGDILVYDGAAYQKLPVGADGTKLTADSTQTTGLKWV